MNKIKILIVEDEQIMAIDLKENLEDMGFIVTGITDTGEQTIEKIKETQPDLVIMDIVIEGNIDGIETAGYIRKMFNIPVIYLTAFTDAETMARAKLSEPFAYLIKPYNEWELKFIIEIATYKHRLERGLSESEKSYRTLAENLPGIVYRNHTRENNKVEFFNNMIRELTGYSTGDLTGGEVCALAPLMIPADKKEVTAQVEQAIQKTRPFEIEYRVTHKNGTIRYFFERGKVVPGKDSRPLFIDGVIFDISDRKQVEEALQKERDRAQRYLDVAGVIMLVINANHKVELINRKGCEILGYSEAEILGKNWFDLTIPENERDTMKEIFTRLMKGEEGQFKYFENPIITKQGEERTIAWTNTSLKDEKGTINGTLSSGLDVSERKKMEDEMQKAEKLESLGILAGGIAHDFNNTLTAILINISLAKMTLDNKERVAERLNEAEKAVNRAQNLTRQLLTFSKGGAPITKLASISELLRETAEFALSGSAVKAEFSSRDNLRNVEIDRGQVSQVIQNLIINAEQAMPKGGTIRISAENETIREKQKPPLKKGKYVKISIMDKGIGIPPAHIDRLFDPFFTTKQKGSGLGLTSAYSIIKSHSGLISVESKLGKGTTFTVYLPASEEKAAADQKKEPAVINLNGKILVMDDEEMILEATGHLLRKIGCTVEIARDGHEAVKRYREARQAGSPFTAVILDLIVPGCMGGKETIRELLEIDPDVKAVVSSGYTTDKVMTNYREYGFAAAVSKPYQPGDLSFVLQQITGSGKKSSGKKTKKNR